MMHVCVHISNYFWKRLCYITKVMLSDYRSYISDHKGHVIYQITSRREHSIYHIIEPMLYIRLHLFTYQITEVMSINIFQKLCYIY